MKRHIFGLVAVFMLVAASLFAADLYNNAVITSAIPITTVSNNDATTGAIIDGNGYGSVTYVITTGVLADSDVTLTPSFEHCALDNCDDTAAATGASLIGTIAGATFAATDDNTVKMIGYSGGKRYTRITITPANNTGSAPFLVNVIRAHPQYAPVTH